MTVSGRPATLPGVESMVGLFINTLPVRVAAGLGTTPAGGRGCRSCRSGRRRCGSTSTARWCEVQSWSEVPRGTPLFESLLVFENYPVDRALPAGAGGGVAVSDVEA